MKPGPPRTRRTCPMGSPRTFPVCSSRNLPGVVGWAEQREAQRLAKPDIVGIHRVQPSLRLLLQLGRGSRRDWVRYRLWRFSSGFSAAGHAAAGSFSLLSQRKETKSLAQTRIHAWARHSCIHVHQKHTPEPPTCAAQGCANAANRMDARERPLLAKAGARPTGPSWPRGRVRAFLREPRCARPHPSSAAMLGGGYGSQRQQQQHHANIMCKVS